ncbi:cupin domain-containing protein [Pelagicoccus sp. SDUM812005]|uniref:cupin domain-containing protein n=1 Tax=Pelagicoccus sp. SDUM812005 TaxID=3041257 RepID=UPI00280C8877|nr:cupin domain-containing protein [Pelagicoccus sp. SDUM812005]MDQ8182628.1 cupin domain-containing protein [Pelagicoccus sp. SDUM812005]
MKFDITCLIPSSQTGGRSAVFREFVQPQVGPPLHSHTKQYEIFHIIDGTFLFQKDGEQVTLTAGGSICIEPGSVHTFKNVGDAPGTLHFELLDAGKSEEFFHRIVTELEQIEDLPAFFAQYDLELLGPPL